MNGTPTLKIRIALDDQHSHAGASCQAVADRIVGDFGKVIDSEWGRPVATWADTGKGWDRPKPPRLTEYELGYLDFARTSDDAVIQRLVEMIDRLTERAS